MADVDETEMKDRRGPGGSETDQTTDQDVDETNLGGTVDPGGDDLLGKDNEGYDGGSEMPDAHTDSIDWVDREVGPDERSRMTEYLTDLSDEDREYAVIGYSWKKSVLDDLELKEKILEDYLGGGTRIRGVLGESTRKLLRSLEVNFKKGAVDKVLGNATGLSFTDGSPRRDGKPGNTYKSAVVKFSGGTGKAVDSKNVQTEFTDLMKKVALEYTENSFGAEVTRTVQKNDRNDRRRTSADALSRVVGEKAKVEAEEAKVEAEKAKVEADADLRRKSVADDNRADAVESDRVDKAGGGEDFEMTEDTHSVSSEAMDEIYHDTLEEVMERYDGQMADLRSVRDSDLDSWDAFADPETRADYADLNVPDSYTRDVDIVMKTGILRQSGTPFTVRIASLDADIKIWGDRAGNELEGDTKKFYEGLEHQCRLQKDYLLVRNGLRPESDEVLGIVAEAVDGSSQLRLERFKVWAKKNMLGISAALISAAGLIVGVTMALKAALRTGAAGVSKFSGAVARVFKKLGPVFAVVGSIVSTALSWGARGISWLSKNLWLLAVVITAALYSRGRSLYGRRRQVAST